MLPNKVNEDIVEDAVEDAVEDRDDDVTTKLIIFSWFRACIIAIDF
jgi:hypothetical protein